MFKCFFLNGFINSTYTYYMYMYYTWGRKPIAMTTLEAGAGAGVAISSKPAALSSNGDRLRRAFSLTRFQTTSAREG